MRCTQNGLLWTRQPSRIQGQRFGEFRQGIHRFSIKFRNSVHDCSRPYPSLRPLPPTKSFQREVWCLFWYNEMSSELFNDGVLWHHFWEKASRPKFDVVRDSCFILRIHDATKVDGSWWLLFRWAHVSEIMKHTNSTKWLANPNGGHNHFPPRF